MSRKILIVEDNELNMKLFNDLLVAHGYSTVKTRDGSQVLEIMREERPDLVLMDVQMPVMDGIEATRQVRHHLHLSKTDLPVVGLTASFQTTDLQMYLDVGMNTCLSKPIRLESLKRTLQCFSQPNAEDELNLGLGLDRPC